MKNQKWTFINVLFSKIQNRFEKTLHHSFSQLLRSISPKSQYIYISFYKGFLFFMIPKRQNHTLPNLMAAAHCELMVAVFYAFRVVTEYAIKCANLCFGFVTIERGKMAVGL
jgi:hypothetical protein